MSDQPVSRRFASQGLDLHYVDWGGEGLPTLLMIHGGNDHCRSWDPLAKALTGRFRVVAPDGRGHGDSAWSPDGLYSVNAHVQDLTALYRALGIESAAIVAHSFGGMVALRYAGLYPETVRRLVAIEGLGFRGEREAKWQAIPVEERLRNYATQLDRALASEGRGYASLDEATERMRAHNPRLSAELARHLAEHAVRLGADGKWRWKYDLRGRVRAPVDITAEERRRLRWRITAPILLVDGTESEFAGDEGSCREFPDARRLLVDRAGHWVQHDRLDVVTAACEDFLL